MKRAKLQPDGLFGSEAVRELPPGDASYRERVLARGRLIVALVLVSIVGSQGGPFHAVALTVLFAVHACVALAILEAGKQRAVSIHGIVHRLDLLWALVIPPLAHEFETALVLIVVFVLLSAVMRWGARATLVSAAVVSIGLLLERVVAVAFHARGEHWQPRGYEGAIEVLEVIVLGNLIALLGEQERRLRTESSLMAHVIDRARQQSGFRGTLEAIFRELLAFSGGHRVIFALREVDSSRAYLWEIDVDAPPGGLEFREIPAGEQAWYLFPSPPALQRIRGRRGSRWITAGLGDRGERLARVPDPVPSGLEQRYSFASMACASDTLGEWYGRFLVLSRTRSLAGEGSLRSVHALVRQFAPVIHNIYLVRRLRGRAGAVERARVARELHDGVIQALFALEMEMQVLRRGPETPPEVGARLAALQGMLRHEVVNLRELMEQMKPLDLGPHQLIDFVAQMMVKFQRDTGIKATFATELHDVPLSSRTCRELARIVQEALINVRRHSRAGKVLVRLTHEEGLLRLVIDDDGFGFGFSGRYSHDDLDRQRKGPTVIKERLRVIGARLCLETHPEQGSRLDIEVPLS
jgi:signal transduction histidine kinase